MSASAGTADRILDAALARFNTQGVTGTTMSQLAGDVGISRVWLYRYFENREAVVRGLIERETTRLLAELAARYDPSTPIEDVLVDAFDYVVGLLRRREFLKDMLRNEPELEVVVPAIAAEARPILRVAAAAGARFLRGRTALTAAEARAVTEAYMRLVLSAASDESITVDFDEPRQRRAFARHVIPRLLATSAAG